MILMITTLLSFFFHPLVNYYLLSRFFSATVSVAPIANKLEVKPLHDVETVWHVVSRAVFPKSSP